MTNDTATTLLLFQDDGKDKLEPARWFAMFQLGLLESWREECKVGCFRMQLDPGNVAQDIEMQRSQQHRGKRENESLVGDSPNYRV